MLGTLVMFVSFERLAGTCVYHLVDKLPLLSAVVAGGSCVIQGLHCGLCSGPIETMLSLVSFTCLNFLLSGSILSPKTLRDARGY